MSGSACPVGYCVVLARVLLPLFAIEVAGLIWHAEFVPFLCTDSEGLSDGS